MAQRMIVIDTQIKQMAYQRWLNRARYGLSPLERPLSRFVHLGIVDSLSEALALSLGRPVALMMGGLVAFVGSAVYYVLSWSAGYSYDYSLPLLLLAVGMGVGWALEILYRLLRLRK